MSRFRQSVRAIALLSAMAAPIAVTPGAAQAQTSNAISPRELAAQINAAIDLIRSGKSEAGRNRLRAALRSVADSDNFALTITAYTNAADAFASARDNATATALYDEALTTRAAQRGGRDVAMLWFNYGWFLSKTNQNARGITVSAEAAAASARNSARVRPKTSPAAISSPRCSSTTVRLPRD